MKWSKLCFTTDKTASTQHFSLFHNKTSRVSLRHCRHRFWQNLVQMEEESMWASLKLQKLVLILAHRLHISIIQGLLLIHSFINQLFFWGGLRDTLYLFIWMQKACRLAMDDNFNAKELGITLFRNFIILHATPVQFHAKSKKQ